MIMKQKTLIESARIVRWAAIAALVLLISAFIVSRLGLDLGPNVQVVRRTHASGHLGAAGDLSALFFAVALVQLIRLLGRLSSGELFAPAVTSAFRTFAFWLMVSAIAGIAAPPIASLMAETTGQAHRIEFRIDLRDVMFLVAGLLMFLVARMLDEATRLDAELKEIV
jgi:Protein of unknown function (DUF2975)